MCLGSSTGGLAPVEQTSTTASATIHAVCAEVKGLGVIACYRYVHMYNIYVLEDTVYVHVYVCM